MATKIRILIICLLLFIQMFISDCLSIEIDTKNFYQIDSNNDQVLTIKEIGEYSNKKSIELNTISLQTKKLKKKLKEGEYIFKSELKGNISSFSSNGNNNLLNKLGNDVKNENNPFNHHYNKQDGFIFGNNQKIEEVVYIPNLGNLKDLKSDSRVHEDFNYTGFRVIKDFEKYQADAKPALISWRKNAGSSPVPNIDIALHFKYNYKANKIFNKENNFNIRYGIGYHRNGSDDKKEKLIKYFILPSFMKNKCIGKTSETCDSFFQSSELSFGPVFEDDKVSKIKKLTGLLELKANFFKKFKNTSLSIVPKTGVEFNDIRSMPIMDNTSEEQEQMQALIDQNFYKYSIDLGLQIKERYKLNYGFTQRHATNDFKLDYHVKTASFEINLLNDDTKGKYTVSFDYFQGKDTPSFEKVERFSVGLGILF